MSFPIKAFRIEIEIETDLRIVERAKQRIVTKLNWAHNFSSKIDFHNDETIHFDLRSMKQSNNNKHTQWLKWTAKQVVITLNYHVTTHKANRNGNKFRIQLFWRSYEPRKETNDSFESELRIKPKTFELLMTFSSSLRKEWTKSSVLLLESKSLVAKMCVITIKLPNRLVYFNGCWCWFVQAPTTFQILILMQITHVSTNEWTNKQTIERRTKVVIVGTSKNNVSLCIRKKKRKQTMILTIKPCEIWTAILLKSR